MNKLQPLLLALALSGCASNQPNLPNEALFVEVFAPDYMEAWIESIELIDQHGQAFESAAGDVAPIHSHANYTVNPKGWPDPRGRGKGRKLPGIGLPETISVRWQSLVEPQTYSVRISIPQSVRENMQKPHTAYCRSDGTWVDGLYRQDIILGLAPGGIAKAWVSGPCLEPNEIGRFEAQISQAGPYESASDGKYRPLTETSKTYIEQFGVPYGSW